MRIVSRKDKINGDDLAFLQKLNNAKIFALDNLHAKCYINQDTAIITSLNLYQYSQQNNIEMGIKIEKKSDPELYNAIYAEVETILSQSKKYDFTIIDNSNSINVKETLQPKENTVHQQGNVSKAVSVDLAHKQYPTTKDIQIEKALRALRTRLSRETGEAAYTIYLDKTIFELIAKKPKTKAELLNIYGIGETKVEKFGEAILSAINN
jgi:superfamily II DNA helicase RecQ